MRTAQASQATPIHKILWVVIVFALTFYVWMMFDLLTHPFEPGDYYTASTVERFSRSLSSQVYPIAIERELSELVSETLQPD